MSEAVSAERLERALARLDGRERPRHRHRPADRACRTSSRMLASFGIRLPGDLVILSRAIVTLDGTLRVIAPQLSLVVGRERADDVDRDARHRPRRHDPRRAAGDAPPSPPTPRSHRPDPHADRTRRTQDPPCRRRGQPPDPAHTRESRAAVAVGAAFLLASVLLLVAADNGPIVASGSGCSRCSATVGCSPAPCCSSEWRRPSLGMGRHDER